MAILFTKKAEADFGRLDNGVRFLFRKHMEKLMQMPPRRHLRHGNPFFCENVVEQARLVYQVDGENILIIRCFCTHKEYDRWFRGEN